jgi:hypothetical protein
MNSKHHWNTDFAAFVKREQTVAAAEGGRVDWARERDEWLGRLKELYGQTESFLAQHIKTGGIKVNYRDIELNEELDRTRHAKWSSKSAAKKLR